MIKYLLPKKSRKKLIRANNLRIIVYMSHTTKAVILKEVFQDCTMVLQLKKRL